MDKAVWLGRLAELYFEQHTGATNVPYNLQRNASMSNTMSDQLPVVAFLFLRRRFHAAHVVVVPRGEFYGMIDQENPDLSDINGRPLEEFHARARRYGEINPGFVDNLVEIGRTEGPWGPQNVWTKFMFFRFRGSELAEPTKLYAGAELLDIESFPNIKTGETATTVSGKPILVDFTVPIARNVVFAPAPRPAHAFA